jgi:hypothetical protein
VLGEALQSHGYGRVIVSVAFPICAGNAVLFAETMTTLFAGMTAGGV